MNGWLYLSPWGLRLVALAGAVLVGLTIARAVRERGRVRLARQAPALGLRLLATAGLLWVALNPTALEPREVPGKPHLGILLDTSSSMSVADVAGRPRLKAAAARLSSEAVRSALEDHFAPVVWTFDADRRAAALEEVRTASADGRASNLGAAVTGAVRYLADRPSQAGLVVVSDGRATASGTEEAARLALARSVPLWMWCVGGEVPRRDLWIEVPGTEMLAFAGAEAELSATLHAVGYPNRSFHVQLLHGKEILETIEAVPGPDGQAAVQATIKAPAQGEHRYVFRAVPAEEEAETGNNERSVFLRVVGERVRVLVVEGRPHWDTKFLVQCLKRHPRMDVTAQHRLADGRRFAVVSAEGRHQREETDLFPRTSEAFARYDVLVMGRGCEAFFEPETASLLTDFVSRQGGSLVFARGKAYGGRFEPLARLDPVLWGEGAVHDVRLALTQAGRTSPVFELASGGRTDDLLARLPPLDQALRTVGVKPLAVTLAGGPHAAGDDSDLPVLAAYHHYGLGRVVTLNTGGMWRWAFHKHGDAEEEFVYTRFWSALLRWLLSGSDFLAGADVALRSDHRLYTDEQQMAFLIRCRGLDRDAYRPRLTIQGGEVSAEIEPRLRPDGTYAAEAGPYPPGRYQVTLRNNIGEPSEMSLAVEVTSASVENRVLSADPPLMQRLADGSDGRRLTADRLADLPEIVAQWRARRELAERKTSLWDRWPVMAGLVLLLGLEWLLRRREGLL